MNRKQRRAEGVTSTKTRIRAPKSQTEVAELQVEMNLKAISQGRRGTFECPDCKVAVIGKHRVLVPPDTKLKHLRDLSVDEIAKRSFSRVTNPTPDHIIQWFMNNPERMIYLRPSIRDKENYLSDDHILKLIEESGAYGCVPHTMALSPKLSGAACHTVMLLEPMPLHQLEAMTDDDIMNMLGGKLTIYSPKPDTPPFWS